MVSGYERRRDIKEVDITEFKVYLKDFSYLSLIL
jgi:hypothetical protein